MRFVVETVEKKKFDNGVHILDTGTMTTHQMLDVGSAKDVCSLLNGYEMKLKDKDDLLRKVLKANDNLVKRIRELEEDNE